MIMRSTMRSTASASPATTRTIPLLPEGSSDVRTCRLSALADNVVAVSKTLVSLTPGEWVVLVALLVALLPLAFLAVPMFLMLSVLWVVFVFFSRLLGLIGIF